MSLILLLELILIAIFVVMFIRRTSLVWGVGLLTVSTAVLLDIFLQTFNRELLLEQFGFLFYLIIGWLIGGAAFWVLGLLWPKIAPTMPAPQPQINPTVPLPPPIQKRTPTETPTFDPGISETGTAYDRQMIYEEIRDRFGREDVLDLMFDLTIPENAVMMLQQDMYQLIINIMDYTIEHRQTGQLALAVERILTPPAPDTLPRLEKMTAVSPPTILRHYLLAHTNLESLQKHAAALGIDWEQLDAGSKKTKIRALLLYLARRNRTDELIALLQERAAPTQNKAS